MHTFDQLNAEAKANNGEFIGSVVFLHVHSDVDVLLSHLVNGMLNHSQIPSDWVPEPINHLSLYLSTITSLGRASVTKFEDHGYKFDDTHGGFSVHRLFLKGDEKMPTAHKIFSVRKIKGADGKIADVNIDDGINIVLNRLSGDKHTDKIGTSQFQIDVTGNISKEYTAFIEVLQKEFDARRNERYNAEQIRTLLIDLLRNKVKATPIKRGDYFVDAQDINAIEAMRDVFSQVDDGIRINPLHIVKYKNAPTLNQTFQSVSETVQDSLVKEMQEFLEELKHLETKDSKTRQSTWADRSQQFMDMQLKLKRMQNKQLIEIDILEDMIKEAGKILVDKEDAPF
jgi:hypothetical protein